MSIQAMTWVLAQPAEDLPGTARLVMLSLANHADHTDGHCWPSIPTISKEAGIGERTVSRYLGALARNGFIDKQQTQKNGHFRSNDYWILFDRIPAPWQFFDKEEEPHAKLADGETTSDPEHRTPTMADGRTPLVADASRMPEPSSLEPSESEIVKPRASTPADSPAPPLQPSAPVALPRGFDANERQRSRDRSRAADEARKAQLIPVIEGSAPWLAWLAYPNPDKGGKCHSPTLVCTIQLPNGRLDKGWNFPTLWPPRGDQTGPPDEDQSSPAPTKINSG